MGKARDLSLDYFKGFLTIGMILAHIVQFFPGGRALSYGSDLIDLTAFSGFLFAFGYVCFLAYMGGGREPCAFRKRMLRGFLKTLLAFYVSGIACTVLAEGNTSLRAITEILVAGGTRRRPTYIPIRGARHEASLAGYKYEGGMHMHNAFPQRAREIMLERFRRDALLSLATVEDGAPRVRTVDGYYQDGCFYVVTYTLSGKMRQIAKNPAVAVCGEWFTAYGTGENLGHVLDAGNARIMEAVRAAFAAWYGEGHVDEADPNTCLLRIRLTDGVLNDNGTKYELDFTQEWREGAGI